MKKFTPRPIRFLEYTTVNHWTIKIYTITDKKEFTDTRYIDKAKNQLSHWLCLSQQTLLENYKIATLILHECKEGCFAIINWWLDENMLQHFVFLAKNSTDNFSAYSSIHGITTCIWELEILWFERNAWVELVLKNNNQNFDAYLYAQLNTDSCLK